MADEKRTGKSVSLSRRRSESRRKIIVAARKLFVEKGYHGTRTQDISRLAGVGHGTFYLHFADKLDCFLAFTNEVCDELEVMLERHLAGTTSGEEGLRRALRAIYEFTDTYPGEMTMAMTNTVTLSVEKTKNRSAMERWAGQWAEWIVEAQGEPVREDKTDPLLLGHMIVGVISQGMAYGALHGREREQLIEEMVKSVMGLVQQPA